MVILSSPQGREEYKPGGLLFPEGAMPYTLPPPREGKPMNANRAALFAVATFVMLTSTTGSSTREETPALYNTAKQKLLSGKPIVGGTVYTSDPNIYCAMADAGFDFLWIEMQHSPLTFS